jgi:hypothetical protein
MAYDWRASRPFTPVWENRTALLKVLAVYRGWYDAGYSDTAISQRIQHRYGVAAAQKFKARPKHYDALSDIVSNKGR